MPARAAAVASVTAAPLAAVAARRARVSGPHGRQLLGGLAGDLRVDREPQSDPASLAVDFHHPDGELVALVENLLHRGDPTPWRHVGDVQQPVGSL